MEGISDIRIVAVDPRRPPVIRKEPYIDLYFELSHKAPADWCEEFNALLSGQKFPASVKAADGLFIESWVRNPDEVPASLALLKQKVAECNERYIAKIRASQGKRDDANSALKEEAGEQGRLNRIVAGLDFGD